MARLAVSLGAAALLWCSSVRAEVPVVTMLADFEDDSVAATIGDVENVGRTACALHRSVIPARGQRCLALDIGVTRDNASAACDLRFREPRRFWQADRVAAFCWLKQGLFDLAFRIRDAEGQVFETQPEAMRTRDRWVRVTGELEPGKLRRIRGDAALVWPIQIEGFRAVTDELGKQTLFFDDLQVEHRVAKQEMIHGEFVFDEPTRIYEPGSAVAAAIEIENCSREEMLFVSVELAWTRPDGSVLRTQRASLTLPPSGRDFRSRQPIDFSQRIDQPGLYRLVARARATGWISPKVFETSIAVMPSNRLLPRGRATFFAVRADLMQEPIADQRLEIAIARDIGVHLLAVETPWETIEPSAGRFDLTTLDPIIEDLVRRNIAPMIVLTDPPGWVTSQTEQLASTLTRLAQRYGAKVTHYQAERDVLPVDDIATLSEVLQQLQERLVQVNGDIRFVSPPLATDAAAAEHMRADVLASPSGLQWCFRTSGDPLEAFQALEGFRKAVGFRWKPAHWWLHEAEPLAGASFFVDAEVVLRHYVHAALAGVGGVMWYDLRDNDNDPKNARALRGLVRRDFSPKASLAGYASASGMLTGLTCRGAVLGTPPEFESALFIGSDRQVAVVLPKPNCVRPAVLAPLQGVPGKFAARDFERRPHEILGSAAGPLLPTLSRPVFLTLELENLQPEAQVAFGQPWLRAPATVFCGEEQSFTIEVEPPVSVRRGSLRIKLAREAPFEAQPQWRYFQAEQGERLEFPIRLTAGAESGSGEGELTVQVSLEGEAVEVPIEVRPIVGIAALAGSTTDLPRGGYRVGVLAAPEGERASASGALHAAYERRYLHVLIAIEDDRFVPVTVSPDGSVTGDDLLFGIAAENAARHAEVRIDAVGGEARLRPASATRVECLDGWRCALVPSDDHEQRLYHVRVPRRILGDGPLRPQTRLLVAVRYRDDDADGLAPTPLTWGGGLDGSRSSEGFHWAILGEEAQP